jgi:hypothetical protein
MQSNYSKQPLNKKPVSESKLTLHYLLNGKPICQADYQLSPDAQFIEIPIPVRALIA